MADEEAGRKRGPARPRESHWQSQEPGDLAAGQLIERPGVREKYGADPSSQGESARSTGDERGRKDRRQTDRRPYPVGRRQSERRQRQHQTGQMRRVRVERPEPPAVRIRVLGEVDDARVEDVKVAIPEVAAQGEDEKHPPTDEREERQLVVTKQRPGAIAWGP